MDANWCRARLLEYLEGLETLEKQDQNGANSEYGDGAALMDRRKHIVAEVFQRLDPYGTHLHPEIEKASIERKKSMLNDAIGRLGIHDELREKLGPAAPAIQADKLHPWIWEPARQLWAIQHYREALNAAARSVNAHIQVKVNRRDVSDDKLIQECFSDKPPEVGKPRLRFPGAPSDPTVQSYGRGTFHLALGCIWAIRNPSAHLASHDVGELEEHEAFEQLAALSAMARLVENCEVYTSAEEDPLPAD